MKRKVSNSAKIIASLALCILAQQVSASLIVENLDALSITGGTNDYGQSFTVPTGTAWNSLTVNFFSTSGIPASTPYAAGTLFLLDKEYLGTQEALSASTAGFVAQNSAITAGVWEFDLSVQLAPDTQYWVYTQGAMIEPIAFNPSGNYSGGFAYQDTGSGYSAAPNVDNGFSINGSAIPEPSTFGLLGIFGGSIFFIRRKKKYWLN